MTTLFLVAACMLMWGLAIFTMKLAGQRLDPITLAVFNAIGQMGLAAFLVSKASFDLGKGHILGVLVGVLFVLGNMAFYKLSQTASVSTLAPLTSLHLVVPVVLGFLILGEPLTLRKGAGILLAIAAVYLFSTVEEPVPGVDRG